ncbi:MAG: B12-binding domain-containing radical SAM protein [Candidatus Helarchaeota archaeon]
MDILLLNPGTELLTKRSYNREPPSGLLTMATYLRMKGLEVKVIDTNDKALFNSYLMSKPPLIGITCLTNTYNVALKTINYIKTKSPDSKIVMGGPHASFMWKEILSSQSNIDFIILGEGEYSLFQLYHLLNNNYRKTKGLAYRNGKKVLSNGFSKIFDVDSFPFPDRKNIIPTHYDVASIIVNRGCPFNCSFCVRQKLFTNVRVRNPLNIVKEMADLENLGYQFINLYDNINIYSDIPLEICKLINKYNVHIPWGAELRGDKLSYQMTREMAKAGCKVIAIGIESADTNLLKLNGKFQSLNKIKSGISNAKKAGIAVQCYFIIGLPGDSQKSFEKTIKFIEKLPLIPGEDRIDFFIATPYPGSRLFDEGNDVFNIKIIDKNWDHYDTEHVIFETDKLSYNEIKSLYGFAKKYSDTFNKDN